MSQSDKFTNVKTQNKRIMYVEPNYVFDISDKTDNSDNLTLQAPHLEDYCIAVDLEAELVDRSGRYATGNGEGTPFIVLSWNNTANNATISFMSGSRIYTDKDIKKTTNKDLATYLKTGRKNENGGYNYVNSLTTDYTNYYYDAITQHGTTELLGIKSIDVNYKNRGVPQVVITFVDVKGGSLFANTERYATMKHQGYNELTGDDMAQVFFQCFFTVPYPKFRIKIKGYYGEPVMYELTCNRFKTQFDPKTGNFEATVTFQGYEFEFLSDVPMTALLAAPYTEEGRKYWDNNFKLNNGNPLLTLTDLCQRMNNAYDTAASEVTDIPVNLIAVNSRINAINETIKYHKKYIKEWAKLCQDYTYCTLTPTEIKSNIMPTTNGALAAYSACLVGVENADNMFSELVNFNNDSFQKALEEYRTKLDVLREKHNIDIEVGNNFEILPIEHLRITKNGDVITNGAKLTKVIKNVIRKFTALGNTNKVKSDRYVIYLFDFSWLNELLRAYNLAKIGYNEIVFDTNTEQQLRSIKNIEKALGESFTIENLMRIILAHFETLMHLMYKCVKQVYTPQPRKVSDWTNCDSRNFADLDLNGSTNTKDALVPPFPLLTINNRNGNDNNIVAETATWSGFFSKTQPETKLIDDLFNGAAIASFAISKANNGGGDDKTTTVKYTVTNDMCVSLYKSLKQLYDRWIPNFKEDEWKMEDFFVESSKKNDASKGMTFHFIDAYYTTIGKTVKINLQTVKDAINNLMMHNSFNSNMFEFIATILQHNNFMLLCCQNFMDLGKKDNMKTMFTPIPYLSQKEPKRHPDFVCIYTYTPSQRLNISNGQYTNDSFMLDGSDVYNLPYPLVNSDIYDGRRKYTLPAFGVTYGMQYQNYFTDIAIETTSSQLTEIALKTQYAIIGDNQKMGGKACSFVGQDLFDAYSTQSHKCTIKMLGNAWIQPLMYFCLLNVPMFRGSYLIQEVSHHIVPNNMVTTVQGMRMSKYASPFSHQAAIVTKEGDANADVSYQRVQIQAKANNSTYVKEEFKHDYIDVAAVNVEPPSTDVSIGCERPIEEAVQPLADTEGTPTPSKTNEGSIIGAVMNAVQKSFDTIPCKLKYEITNAENGIVEIKQEDGKNDNMSTLFKLLLNPQYKKYLSKLVWHCPNEDALSNSQPDKIIAQIQPSSTSCVVAMGTSSDNIYRKTINYEAVSTNYSQILYDVYGSNTATYNAEVLTKVDDLFTKAAEARCVKVVTTDSRSTEGSTSGTLVNGHVGDWNAEAAVRFLWTHAAPFESRTRRFHHRCTSAVVSALVVGGFNPQLVWDGHGCDPTDMYRKFKSASYWDCLGEGTDCSRDSLYKELYAKSQIGDVLVFYATSHDMSAHHACMYCGKNDGTYGYDNSWDRSARDKQANHQIWISDFIQGQAAPNRNTHGAWAYFRYKGSGNNSAITPGKPATQRLHFYQYDTPSGNIREPYPIKY